MTAQFTQDQIAAMKELVGLPARLRHGDVSQKTSVSLGEVQRVLDLPDLPFCEGLSADCWLAGGSLLRWLFGGLGQGRDSQGDFDLYFPSLDAYNSAAQRLMSSGYTFRCFRMIYVMCQLCGKTGTITRRDEIDGLTRPLPRVLCRKCGEFGGIDAASLRADRLLRLTDKIVQHNLVMALELASPNMDIFHLSVASIHPTPHEVIADFSYSLVQFASDGRYLYSAPHAWTDILRSRFRATRSTNRNQSLERMRKYIALGFTPDPWTQLKVYSARLRPWRLKKQGVKD